MTDTRAFRGFSFPGEVILWAVRWYLRFPVGYRDLELMLADRGGRPNVHVPLGPTLRAELHKEMGLLSRKMAGMLLLQAGLVATLSKLL